MTELDEIRTQISDLRELVNMADSEAMDTRQLLRSQTHLMNALRETQNQTNIVLGEQGMALGGMVLAINALQVRVGGMDGRLHTLTMKVDEEAAEVKRRLDANEAGLANLDGRLAGVEGRLEGVEGRFDGVEGRLAGVEGHLEGVEGQLVGLNKNVGAIMRHLGVGPE